MTEEELDELKRIEADRIAEETARVAAETRERLCQEKISSLQAYANELNIQKVSLNTFRSTCEWHEYNRSILTSPTSLNERRQQHEASKKNLKSDLKKCTAFVKKVKAASSFQCSTPFVTNEDFSNHPLVKDVATLNLSRYVDEIASSLLEAKFKVVEVPLVVALCCALHERYSEFLPSLLPKLVVIIQSPSSASAGDNDDMPVKQRRVYFRLLTEFVLNGIVTDPKPLLKIVAEAAGSPKTISVDKGQNLTQLYQVTDANLLSSFVRSAGVELLGTVPRSIRLIIESVKAKIKESCDDMIIGGLPDENKTGDNRVMQEDLKATNESILESVVPSDLFSLDQRVVEAQQNLDDVMREASELIDIFEGSLLLKRACVPSVCNTFRDYCTGAFESLLMSYAATASKLSKLEKRCEQDRLLSGSLSEARERGLVDARKLLGNLRKSVETMAEALDRDVPTIVEEPEEEEASGMSGGVEVWTKADGEAGDADLGPFDDEETRSFYRDIPDFLSTKPPALLGLSPSQVEDKKAKNTVKYGGHDMEEEEEDETSPENFTEDNLRDLENSKTEEEPQKLESGDEVAVDQNAPHYKLSVLLDEELIECNRREIADELAEKFCINHGSNKNSRKRLTKALFSVPRTRLDLLPQYARFACTLDHVYDDIVPNLVDDLESQFHGQTKFKKNQNVESRMKTARFIGELTKFQSAPPIVALRCLKRCTDDFSGVNIDVACCLLESCGRFLFRTKHTKARLSKIIDTMMRIRKAKNFDERTVAMLQSAFFMVDPPQRKAHKVSKVFPPLEAYVQYLFTVKLTADPSSISFVSKQLLRLPWNDPTARCGSLIGKHLLKALRRGRHGEKDAAFDIASLLKKSRREAIVRMLDFALEELQWSLENPSFRNQQRALGIARVLGNLHAVSLAPSPVVLDQLHGFINFGHEVTPAMKDANLKQQSHSHDRVIASNIQAPRSRAAIIPEDQEYGEQGGEGNEGFISVDEEILKPVPISPFASHDPRIPCVLDPPNSVLRVKLVCCLLEACGSSLVTHPNLPKLRYFYTCFQRYLFTKSALPVEVKFAVLDAFDAFDSNIRLLLGTKEQKKKRRKRGVPKDSEDQGVFTFLRYTSWREAHQAVIETEEADAEAEIRAKNRLIFKSGGTGSAPEALSLGEGDEAEEDFTMMDDESLDGNSDDASEGADSTSSSSSDDTDADTTHEDVYSEETEDESDEDEEVSIEDTAAAEEAYARQLEQEEFERELRKMTQEAVEKGKIAARAGTGGKVSETMVHASQFISKKPIQEKAATAKLSAESPFALGGESGTMLKLLKKGNKGKVEAKQLIVPDNTILAIQATKQGEEEAKERDILKARVLQYELESSEQSSGNVYINQEKLQVIRNRPLSMDDIERNFGTSSGTRDVGVARGGGRVPGRGRGRGGRTLKHY